MITGYDVCIINNEKVLFLYLNYDNEFGLDLKKIHKHGNMEDEIKKFIKKRRIKFDGEKIALSFGGVVLALLLIVENPTLVDDLKFTYVSDHIIHDEIIEVVTPPSASQDVIEDMVDDSQNNIIVTDKQESSNSNLNTDNTISNSQNKPSNNNLNSSQNTSNNNQNTNHSNSIANGNTNSSQNNSSNNQNVNQSNNNSSSSSSNNSSTEKKEEVEVPKEEINNNSSNSNTSEKQVMVYRTNGKVITLSLEEYLIGVVGAEMPASFPIEALKAQAVVARTYALKKIQSGGKLTDSVSTQSYKDNDQLKQLWGNSYDVYYQKIKSAVYSTKDLAIYYQGDLIDAVYHSTSNGKTQDSIYVWGNNIPYLKSVDSSWDKEASSYLREVSKDFVNVLNILGIDISEDVSFEVLSRDNSGRVLEIRVGNKTFSGVDFRNLLGLRSADFDLVLVDENLIITTRGYGHGVGLSQYGASGMAKSGYNYKQILNHYYTGVSIY